MPIDATLLEAVRAPLISGKYQLLLGAGASKDSLDTKGAALPTGAMLASELTALKKLNAGSSLSRAYAQLSTDEVQQLITNRFSNITPGPTINRLKDFYWQRIYSLNIDDALENSYARGGAKQSLVSLIQSDDFQNLDDADCLQVVHIHGHVKRPSDGYVFSSQEYARRMNAGNAWTGVLSQTMATEPFIIAGTSLQEPDLEYFLASRSSSSVRIDRGPSFLIDPFADAATEAECRRHGFHLYRGEFLQFLNELDAAIPSRPRPLGVPHGLTASRFRRVPPPASLAIFGKSISHLSAAQVVDDYDLGFFVGREPQPSDIALNRDIPRSDTEALKATLRDAINKSDARIIISASNSGTGKSTQMLRTLYDLAGEGLDVFSINTSSSIDAELSASILAEFDKPFILYCDNIADHATNIAEFYRRISRNDFCIVGCERAYRLDYVRQTFAAFPFHTFSTSRFTAKEAETQIHKLVDEGLAAINIDPKQLPNLTRDLARDPICVSGCRIMNDFRPIDRIVGSMIDSADDRRLMRYLAVAIANYCYREGLNYSILVSAFETEGLSDQISTNDVLPIAFTDRNKDYIRPLNPFLSDMVLRKCKMSRGVDLFEAYCQIGRYLAPYVNRSTIIRRTAEARLAARLFDYDDVVSEFFTFDECKQFFEQMKKNWSWNSRYWEQFALFKLHQSRMAPPEKRALFLSEAIAHARHAVTVENHQLPLTTLGLILLEEMKVKTGSFTQSFEEAARFLIRAITLEGQANRIAIHPYMTLFRGAVYFLQNGGKLKSAIRIQLQSKADTAEMMFRTDNELLITLANLRPLLSA